jgi:hypothetical protein
MIMKKITILEITMMPSLKNPEVDVEALKGGILLVVGAAASANSEGQVPKRLPKRFRHIVFVDPVKDPKAADMAEKDPRVLAMEEEAEVVAPNLMREGVPLVVISYAGQVPESTRKEWSTLLGVSEEDLACYQRRRKVALFGMGCGASPIENWESFFQALTKEYLEVIDKVMVLLPLGTQHTLPGLRRTRRKRSRSCSVSNVCQNLRTSRGFSTTKSGPSWVRSRRKNLTRTSERRRVPPHTSRPTCK